MTKHVPSQSIEKPSTPTGTQSSTTKTYVEISPRRTGKTTRLKAAARNHLDNGGEVFLMAHRAPFANIIKKEILRFYNAGEGMDSKIFVIRTVEALYSYASTLDSLRGLQLHNPRLFVDEADLIDTPSISFIEGSYYCGTSMNGNLAEYAKKVGKHHSYEVEVKDGYVNTAWPPNGGILRVRSGKPETITKTTHKIIHTRL